MASGEWLVEGGKESLGGWSGLLRGVRGFGFLFVLLVLFELLQGRDGLVDLADAFLAVLEIEGHDLFLGHAVDALEEKLAEVAERGGFAGRDAPIGREEQELADGEIYGGGSVQVFEGPEKLGAKFFRRLFARDELELLAGMMSTEGGMGGGAKHAAAFSVFGFVLAAGIGVGV